MCQAHLIPKFDAHFLCHSGCHWHSCHSAGLSASDLHASFSVALWEEQQVEIFIHFFPHLRLMSSCSVDHFLLPAEVLRLLQPPNTEDKLNSLIRVLKSHISVIQQQSVHRLHVEVIQENPQTSLRTVSFWLKWWSQRFSFRQCLLCHCLSQSKVKQSHLHGNHYSDINLIKTIIYIRHCHVNCIYL